MEINGRFALLVENTGEWVARRFHAILGLGSGLQAVPKFREGWAPAEAVLDMDGI